MAVLDQQKLVQIGDEVAWGTLVAPTVELSGIEQIIIAPSQVTEIVQAMRGGIVPGRDLVNIRHEVDGCTVEGWVIYEQIAYWLDGMDEVTPAGVGPYTYTYDGPTTTQPTPRPQSLVSGPTNLVYGLSGMALKSITFTWNWGEGLKYSADLMGHSVAADTVAALDEAAGTALTYARACDLTVAVDALAGTIGATTIAETQSGSITIDLNRKYLRRTGSCYPSGFYDGPWMATGEIVFENSATTAAYVDAIVAGGTTKLLELDFNNGGAAAAERGLRFQMASQIEVDQTSDEADSLSVIKLKFKPIEEGDWTTPAAGELDGYLEILSTSSTATLY